MTGAGRYAILVALAHTKVEVADVRRIEREEDAGITYALGTVGL
jgi:hypothetical protein